LSIDFTERAKVAESRSDLWGFSPADGRAARSGPNYGGEGVATPGDDPVLVLLSNTQAGSSLLVIALVHGDYGLAAKFTRSPLAKISPKRDPS
jgi:hypothetical protein